MGKSIKSAEKEKRSWDELNSSKKAYLKRKQEEDDARDLLSRNEKAWNKYPDEPLPF